jgi:hypothetical protein
MILFSGYDVIKQNKNRIAGLNAVADEMGTFFKKTKKKTATA